MSAVVLDTSPLGVLCHPRNPPHVIACWQWLVDLEQSGRRIILPEISDFEFRRKAIHRNQLKSIRQLDLLVQRLEYVPITTPTMRRAAALWAEARSLGLSATGPDDLDADMILIAQAESLGGPFVIASRNAKHITSFATVADWPAIAP